MQFKIHSCVSTVYSEQAYPVYLHRCDDIIRSYLCESTHYNRARANNKPVYLRTLFNIVFVKLYIQCVAYCSARLQRLTVAMNIPIMKLLCSFERLPFHVLFFDFIIPLFCWILFTKWTHILSRFTGIDAFIHVYNMEYLHKEENGNQPV